MQKKKKIVGNANKTSDNNYLEKVHTLSTPVSIDAVDLILFDVDLNVMCHTLNVQTPRARATSNP